MRFGIKKQVSAAQNIAITLINIFIGGGGGGGGGGEEPVGGRRQEGKK
jgi:hypothetical protein